MSALLIVVRYINIFNYNTQNNFFLQKPGKLNMNNFTQVTDALSKINLISNKSHNCGAPSKKPDNLISPEYETVCKPK